MSSLLSSAANLLLGARCPLCQATAWGVCAQCQARLKHQTPTAVSRPGIELPIIAAHDYRPDIQRLVPRFKDDGALHLERFLAGRLAAALASLSCGPSVIVVPIPSAPSSVRRRGVDHMRRLACVAAGLENQRWAPLLIRLPRRRQQRGLDRSARQTNASGAMVARGTVTQVVLVDDVVTSGASLREGHRALKHAGVTVVGAAVIGHADRL
ncbi:MAG: ComF family protein [Arachnia sp.]